MRKHTGGRPPIEPGQASVTLTTRVLERQRAELVERAEREGVSPSELVRRAVVQYLTTEAVA